MKKILGWSAFFTLDALIAASVAYGVIFFHPLTARQDFARMQSTSVSISYNIKREGSEEVAAASGSGTMVKTVQKDDEWVTSILTAKHVIASLKKKNEDGSDAWEPMTITRWIYRNGEQPTYHRLTGTVVRVSKKSDLALIQVVSHERLPVVKIADTPAKVGDRVISVGFPVDFPNVVSPPGFVSVEEYHYPGETELLQISSAVSSPGNSGGALYSERYEVVGVVVRLAGANLPVQMFVPTPFGIMIAEGMAYERQNHLVLSSPLRSIKEFLNDTE